MRPALLTPDERPFGARLIANVKRGLIMFFRPKPWWIQLILIVIAPIMPVFWVANTLRRKTIF